MNDPGDVNDHLTFCPDCEKDIPASEFIAHREKEHPPSVRVLVPGGIKSEEAVHGGPPPAA